MATLRELIPLYPDPERQHIRLYGSILDETVPDDLVFTARLSQDPDHTEEVWWLWLVPVELQRLTEHWLGHRTEMVDVYFDKLNPVYALWNPLEGPSHFIKLDKGVVLRRGNHEPALRTERPCIVRPASQLRPIIRDGSPLTLEVPVGALIPMTS